MTAQRGEALDVIRVHMNALKSSCQNHGRLPGGS